VSASHSLGTVELLFSCDLSTRKRCGGFGGLAGRKGFCGLSAGVEFESLKQ